MGKLIFWFFLILLALVAWRVLNTRSTARNTRAPRCRQAAGQQPAETMVRCAHCGIHLPRSEALLTHGNTWCSPHHARLGPLRERNRPTA